MQVRLHTGAGDLDPLQLLGGLDDFTGRVADDGVGVGHLFEERLSTRRLGGGVGHDGNDIGTVAGVRDMDDVHVLGTGVTKLFDERFGHSHDDDFFGLCRKSGGRGQNQQNKGFHEMSPFPWELTPTAYTIGDLPAGQSMFR